MILDNDTLEREFNNVIDDIVSLKKAVIKDNTQICISSTPVNLQITLDTLDNKLDKLKISDLPISKIQRK
jgi:hypothetical protein